MHPPPQVVEEEELKQQVSIPKEQVVELLTAPAHHHHHQLLQWKSMVLSCKRVVEIQIIIIQKMMHLYLPQSPLEKRQKRHQFLLLHLLHLHLLLLQRPCSALSE